MTGKFDDCVFRPYLEDAGMMFLMVCSIISPSTRALVGTLYRAISWMDYLIIRVIKGFQHFHQLFYLFDNFFNFFRCRHLPQW